LEKILTFKVGEEKFCIDIFNIIGIDQKTKVSSVPMSAKHHIGMMNLRGQIIPVLDLRILFQVTIQTNEKEQCYVFVETDSKKMACLVDTVYDVVDFKDVKLAQSTTDQAEKNNFVSQIMNINNEIVFQLSTEQIYNSISNENNLKNITEKNAA
jgi:purine-binding chemotaxis protein CheW